MVGERGVIGVEYVGSEEGERSWSQESGCRFVDSGWLGDVDVDVGSKEKYFRRLRLGCALLWIRVIVLDVARRRGVTSIKEAEVCTYSGMTVRDTALGVEQTKM